jgi:hypothetical protein
MKTFYLIITSLLLLCNVLFSQTVISGKVLDGKTKTPIAFVNIGVLNRSIGTVSDELGNFQLTISTAVGTDTFKISAIGYDSYKTIVSQATNAYNNNKDQNVILLSRRTELLPEVVIKPKNIKKLILGSNSKKENINCFYFPTGVNLGYEAGLLLKYNKKNPGYIENLNFNIKKLLQDSIILRVNLYEIDKTGQPQANILATPIYVKGKKGDEMLTVSFPPNTFFIKKDTYLSLEWIKAGSDGLFNVDCSIFGGGGCYIRETSQDTWEHLPVGNPSFWATVWYEK